MPDNYRNLWPNTRWQRLRWLSACAVGIPAGSREHAESSSTADTGVFVRRAVSAQNGRRLSGGMDSEYGVVVVDEGIPGAEFAARLGKGCEWGIAGVRAGRGGGEGGGGFRRRPAAAARSEGPAPASPSIAGIGQGVAQAVEEDPAGAGGAKRAG